MKTRRFTKLWQLFQRKRTIANSESDKYKEEADLFKSRNYSDKEQAKKIFFYYACNIFFMDHNGTGDKYRKYRISKTMEEEWRREYISFWISRLSTDDLGPVHRLENAWAYEALPDLIKWSDKGDCYAKLWYSNAIWQISRGSGVPETLRREARMKAIDLWKDLSVNASIISEEHKVKISPNVKFLGATTPEEYIMNYAKRNLAGTDKY